MELIGSSLRGKANEQRRGLRATKIKSCQISQIRRPGRGSKTSCAVRTYRLILIESWDPGIDKVEIVQNNDPMGAPKRRQPEERHECSVVDANDAVHEFQTRKQLRSESSLDTQFKHDGEGWGNKNTEALE
jgi:hypothetical protein